MCCCRNFTDFCKSLCGAMSLDETRQSQRPYRYGMVLLCIGALINWLGLAENYVEPVRYIGVACIIAGALLICAAMCCWLQAPVQRQQPQQQQNEDPIHVISVPPDDEVMQQKPPDYESVAGAPPTYDDAIKLNPAHLPGVHHSHSSSSTVTNNRINRSSLRSTSNAPHILNVLLTPANNSRNTVSAPLETVTVIDNTHNTIPQTPPPPYRPLRSIR